MDIGRKPPAARRKDQGGTRTRRELISKREMLNDAPAQFAPQWLDAVENQALKEHVRKAYLAIRELQDDGTGISILRDMLIRRVVYLERICNRLELAMEYWTDRVIAGKPYAEERLLEYQRFYHANASVMLQITKRLGLDKRGAAPQNPGSGTAEALTAPTGGGGIVIPGEFEHDPSD